MSEASLEAIQRRAEGGDASAGAAAAAPNRVRGGVGLDRGRTLSFRWEGRTLNGFSGDTLASALLANGARIVGRSFKYHRPRGVMSAGAEEGGALVTTGAGARRTPNTNAAMEELFDGLTAFGQNAWPSLNRDFGAVNNLFGRFFSAGFYYKTFFSVWPTGGKGTRHWMWFEEVIRRAAGMGRAARAPDPDAYETAHAFCDALVIGSGPAGLEAARILAEAGQDVVLAEQDFTLGGRLLSESESIEGAPPDAWRREKLAALEAAGVRILSRATVFGLYDDGVAGLVERVSRQSATPEPHQPRQRVWLLRAGQTVIAAGALERSIAFGDNDRPGVMTAGAARAYLNRFGVLCGRRAVIATTNDSAYGLAADLAAAGAQATILDTRAEPAIQAPEGVAVRRGMAAMRALGARGVTGVELAESDGDGWREAAESMPCDLLAVSGGWSPVVNLLSHRSVKPVWDAERAAFLPGQTDEPIALCGAAAGAFEADACAVSGRNAANRILGRAEEETPARPAHARPIRPLYEVRVPTRKLKSFVDPQHDVTAADVRLAHKEGFVSVEHLKRYTTLGMAADQGKNGNIIGLALMAEALGREIPQVGVTTFRPPYTPVAIGALAGRQRGEHFKPVRETPMHDWNMDRGAVMTDAGLWKRPWYFPGPGEGVDQAYVREAAAVRETVGLCDVTSLGKIAIQGPDAAEFLNRIYVNGFSKLAVGRARYGVMLRDDGVAFDDGTTWRLAENDYFMTCTTAGAGKVMSFLEELQQTRWPELKVALTSVSERWAGMAVAGPLSRRVLEHVVRDCNFDDESFPFMGVREGRIADAAARIARISFSGELAYEIYIESDYGHAMAEALWEAAEPVGGVLYGTEALGALRIEKGHVTHSEIDGRTTLADLGLERMASSKKPFVGSVLSRRAALADAFRPRLVGLKPVTEGEIFKNGAILTDLGQQIDGGAPTHGIGWVSSVTHSPALGCWIGLGLVQGGLEVWRDKTILAADPVRGKTVRVKVVSPHMVDAEGARLKPAETPAPLPADDRAEPAALRRRTALGVDLTPGAPAWRYGRGPIADPESERPDADDRPAWIVEGAPKTLWQICAHDGGLDAARAAVERALQAPAPEPGRCVASPHGVSAIRVGPLTWQVVGLGPAGAEELAMTSDASAAVLELSHGYTRLRIGGARAADLLNRFLPLDLRDRSFGLGAVATTGFHATPATLTRPGATIYDLWIPRGYARTLCALLEETARQF